MIYQFKIGTNTGAFPPVIREEDQFGNVDWEKLQRIMLHMKDPIVS